MSFFELAAAIVLLLVTPGPTNSLMALAGAERGLANALRVIPAELLGYLVATLPLALVGARLLEAVPVARDMLTVVAAGWVLWLALAMWRIPAMQDAARTVTGQRVLTTTLLNPKTLVFGLVLLPATNSGRLLINFALFATLIVAVAVARAALGSALRGAGREGGLPRGWRRAASIWLGALAVYLISRVAGLA